MENINNKTIGYNAWYFTDVAAVTFVSIYLYIDFKKRGETGFSSGGFPWQKKPFIYNVEVPDIVKSIPFNNCLPPLSTSRGMERKYIQNNNNYRQMFEKV